MRFLEAIENKVIVPLAVTLFMFSCIWMLIESLSRQFFNKSYDFSEELVIYTLIWAIFLTLGKGGKKDVHIVVDLFTSKFSKRTFKITTLFNSIIGLIYAAFLVYVGISYVQHLMNTGIKSHSSLMLPMSAVLLIIPIGMTFLGLFYLGEIKKIFVKENELSHESEQELQKSIELIKKEQKLQRN